ncbi:MAG: sigma 54-interacting transcriptional regulator, partial [Myxococcales bacterium]|nr:sigma 54-interacting transcriptional regulator [Myxococcales bacterium]
MNPKILVADDKADFAEAVALVLGEVSDEIQIVASGEAALEAIAEDPPDLIFSDLRMQGMSGLELLRRIGERVPRARTILFTGYATIESAVEAMKGGAFDYLTKPVDHDELLLVARRAWKEIVDQQELCMLRAEVQQARCFRGIWGRDPHMLPVFEMIRRVAPTPASVLIFGESGTGKELVARALHDESERADQPFVAFNAAAVPEGIAESELFGCRKGAYTGADRDRKGLFAEANGGTLLIDE